MENLKNLKQMLLRAEMEKIRLKGDIGIIEDDVDRFKAQIRDLEQPVMPLNLTDEYGNEYEFQVRDYNPECEYEIIYDFISYNNRHIMKYENMIDSPLHGIYDSGTASYMNDIEELSCAMSIVKIKKYKRHESKQRLSIENCKLIGDPKSKNVWIKLSNDWYCDDNERNTISEVNIQSHLLPMLESQYHIAVNEYDKKRDRLNKDIIYIEGKKGSKSNPFIVRRKSDYKQYHAYSDPINVFDGFLSINGEISSHDNIIHEDKIPFMNLNYKETWEKLKKERIEHEEKEKAEAEKWERERPQREAEEKKQQLKEKAEEAEYRKEHPKAHKYYELTAKILMGEVWSKPAEQVGNDYGVSGRAIGKLCKKLNVPKPPVGFWAKVHAGKIEHPNGVPIYA